MPLPWPGGHRPGADERVQVWPRTTATTSARPASAQRPAGHQSGPTAGYTHRPSPTNRRRRARIDWTCSPTTPTAALASRARAAAGAGAARHARARPQDLPHPEIDFGRRAPPSSTASRSADWWTPTPPPADHHQIRLSGAIPDPPDFVIRCRGRPPPSPSGRRSPRCSSPTGCSRRPRSRAPRHAGRLGAGPGAAPPRPGGAGHVHARRQGAKAAYRPGARPGGPVGVR
jgi:translation initiation factor IF-2